MPVVGVLLLPRSLFSLVVKDGNTGLRERSSGPPLQEAGSSPYMPSLCSASRSPAVNRYGDGSAMDMEMADKKNKKEIGTRYTFGTPKRIAVGLNSSALQLWDSSSNRLVGTFWPPLLMLY
ncbi:hypothetical protein ZWY2020_016261 [Hordeum vulgare]|nr:hypothetical protein ZWY2020_016261 [Hordeum vulgare]